MQFNAYIYDTTGHFSTIHVIIQHAQQNRYQLLEQNNVLAQTRDKKK